MSFILDGDKFGLEAYAEVAREDPLVTTGISNRAAWTRELGEVDLCKACSCDKGKNHFQSPLYELESHFMTEGTIRCSCIDGFSRMDFNSASFLLPAQHQGHDLITVRNYRYQ